MKANFIPLTNTEAIMVTERGEERLVEFKETGVKFWSKAPLKEYSHKEIVEILSSADEKLYELETLLNAVESVLADRFLNGWLEEDEEAKDEVRQVLRLIDITKRHTDSTHRLVNSVTNSMIKGA